jgi:hypothetical protein
MLLLLLLLLLPLLPGHSQVLVVLAQQGTARAAAHPSGPLTSRSQRRPKTWEVLRLHSLHVYKKHACPAHDSGIWVGWKYNINPRGLITPTNNSPSSCIIRFGMYDWSCNTLPYNLR